MCCSAAYAKDTPLAVIDWPTTGSPVIRFTFGKFKTFPGMGSLHGYVMDTIAQDLSPRLISSARFSVYLFDKAKARVGEDAMRPRGLSGSARENTLSPSAKKASRPVISRSKSEGVMFPAEPSAMNLAQPHTTPSSYGMAGC